MSAALTGIEGGLYFCTACLFSKGNTLDQSEGVVCCYCSKLYLAQSEWTSHQEAMNELFIFKSGIS